MNTEILTCPNCTNRLFKSGKSYRCKQNHSFDLAKEGYLNLLLANQKKSKLPGDSKEMILNREAFLSLGYYDQLVDIIIQKIRHGSNDITNDNLSLPANHQVLDLGCGSGFFLRQLVFNGNQKTGLDISKYAIAKAAKIDKDSTYLVSSYKDIPILSDSVDVVLNNFAPLDLQEVLRILKPNGRIIKVIPFENHMRQLAALIYQTFRPHSSDYTKRLSTIKELEIADTQTLAYDMKIPKTHALQLIGMTPYYHKFKHMDIKLPQEFEVTFSFQVIEVIKKGQPKMTN